MPCAMRYLANAVVSNESAGQRRKKKGLAPDSESADAVGDTSVTFRELIKGIIAAVSPLVMPPITAIGFTVSRSARIAAAPPAASPFESSNLKPTFGPPFLCEALYWS